MGDDLNKLAEDMMQIVLKKLNDSKSANAEWGKTINMTFSDIDVTYALKYANDGSVTCEKKSADDAIVNLSIAVPDLKKIMDGEIGGSAAFHDGLMQVEGDLMSLMKLMPALGS
jgi:putative sterol carrier protein